ncbi:MAG: amino acid ABC transporter permease [Bacillota bacterium]|nr:amino acid ABC transporter permease [Bacillota bacterium]
MSWSDFCSKFQTDFIEKGRWLQLANGLLMTIEIAIGAVILGIAIGFVIAVVRSTYDKNSKGIHNSSDRVTIGSVILWIANVICKFYLTLLRGMPIMVFVLITYFIIFANYDVSPVLIAVFAFGINSGAYVAEIMRAGIMSIDEGQFEAGRSLGLNYVQTMTYIIAPQAFKNVLPALLNEFITLLKETSVVGYIGMNDLTRAAILIKSDTYDAFLPLIVIAIIYIILVILLTKLVSILERRLRVSGR